MRYERERARVRGSVAEFGLIRISLRSFLGDPNAAGEHHDEDAILLGEAVVGFGRTF